MRNLKPYCWGDVVAVLLVIALAVYLIGWGPAPSPTVAP
jgi:hypothetical protein